MEEKMNAASNYPLKKMLKSTAFLHQIKIWDRVHKTAHKWTAEPEATNSQTWKAESILMEWFWQNCRSIYQQNNISTVNVNFKTELQNNMSFQAHPRKIFSSLIKPAC